jgi:signal transduction histidine kinase
MDLVIGELRRVARLLNDLLSQSRQVPESPAEVHLATCASELLSLLRYQVPQGVHLQQDIPAGLRCYLPEGGLRQALLNLVLNAAQALGEQAGTITVNAHPAAAGKLRVSVCDDGPGFPAELLSGGVRAFATWRENGTGLGLATVRRFVRDIGGEMELGNRQPKGACVSLTLPCGESRV